MHSPLLLGRGPAECICNLQLQPSHSDPQLPLWAGRLQGAFAIWNCSRATYECTTSAADRPAIAAEILQLQPRFCNCSRNSAIAAERCSAAVPDCKCTLQALRPREGWGSEWLGCNFRLQMHSAVSPPTRVLPCRFYPDRPRTQRKAERSGLHIVHLHSGIAGQPSLATPRAHRGVRITSSRRVRFPAGNQTCKLAHSSASSQVWLEGGC